MTGYILLILVAIIGGVAVTLQGQFMGLMDGGIGTRDCAMSLLSALTKPSIIQDIVGKGQ